MNTNQSCPYCHKTAPSKLHAKDWNRTVDDLIFNYHKCGSCNSIFLSSPPQDITKYYPNEYHTLPSNVESFAAHLEPEHYKLEMIRQWIDHGRLLDIGPSVGGFLYLAKQAGFDAHALEMDPKCCQFLRECLKIPTIESGDIKTSLKDQKTYDMITLWHVVEHLHDPWSDLKAIVEALKPGGYLLLAAPNPDAFQFKIFKSRWVHLDAPRHLMLIPHKLFQTFFAQLGLELVYATTSDLGGLHWNIFGWEYSLKNLFPFLPGRIKRKILPLASRILAKIFSPIEGTKMRGSAYTMIFKKKDI